MWVKVNLFMLFAQNIVSFLGKRYPRFGRIPTEKNSLVVSQKCHPFSGAIWLLGSVIIHLSHEKKLALLSMKYRLFNRDPYNGLL